MAVTLIDSPPSTASSARRAWSVRAVVGVAAGLIVAQLVLRGWVAASGFFYWDDFILIGQVSRHSLWSAELLLTSHDGHVMPLAIALTWVVTQVAPMSWGVAAAVLVGLQLVASVAVLRLLVVLMGWRRCVLGPLVFYLFVPLTVPAFAWWAAAVNALPLQIALAWVSADAVLLARTGQRRYAVSGALVFAVALLSFEKSIVVLPVAFAVVALSAHVAGQPWRAAVSRGGLLWAAGGAVLLTWAAVFLLVIQRPRGLTGPEDPGALLSRALSDGLVPALFGGPWRWERWQPATPWADPPGVAVFLCWMSLILLAAWTIRSRARVAVVWLCAAGYGIATIAPVIVLRDGPGTAALLLQSMRYFADFAVIATVSLALILRAPASTVAQQNSSSPPEPDPSDTRPRTAGMPPGELRSKTGSVDGSRPRIGLMSRPPKTADLTSTLSAIPVVLFVLSSVVSTITFTRSWEPSPARTYITGVRAALPATRDAPLLPQEVPWNVLNPLAFPQNMTDHVLAPIATPTTFAAATPTLRMITDTGEIVDAYVWWNRSITPGSEPQCGHRVRAGTSIPLDGPMQIRDWTAQLNYLADRDGRIAVSFDGDTETVADVRKGLNTVYVRLLGGGDALRIRPLELEQSLCIGVGPVGVAAFAR
ncbi:hypothetical protein [Nocardia caishijiensis]|uniref:Transmembrane protein n=1 Tax=Nocardia caishijiensis TaxID=184756 RepID=A0ABQ6YED3_9NOCA|nr:hypothetical protein [Nocardia caishijiensis]KAF0835779.1 hypothetical protein FNL39_11725 [Nocardia caishijiensis]